jgi:hypothetical protein
MKIHQLYVRYVAVIFSFAVTALVMSCKDDAKDPIAGDVGVSVKNEATQDSQQDEVDDISTNAMNQKAPAENGRYASNGDGRFACAYVTFVAGNQDSTAAVLTIDFDKNPDGSDNPDGCTDPRGNVRKGKIEISWLGGRWYKVGSTITVTLDGYSLNGVVMNGTRTLHNITTDVLKPTWTVESNINVTWPDQKTANRQVHKTRQWDIIAAEVIVTQTAGAQYAAEGTTRRGVSYTVLITNPLIFKLSCVGTSKVYIPVQGTKVISFNNKTVTVDFGTGECDNTFTVTLDGRTDSMNADNGSDD